MEKQMKFMFLPFVLVALIAFNSFANPVSLVSDTRGEITLNFTLPGYSVSNVNADGETFGFISVSDAAFLKKKGYAALPYFTQSIMIPDKAAMGVEIVDVTYKEVKVNRLMPSRGVIYRNQDPSTIPYVVDPNSLVDAWYPSETVTLGSPYILRHIRGIAIRFQPFQYNPVKGVLKVAESITVKVKAVGVSTVNILTKKKTSVGETFDKVYNQHFLNYTVNRSRYDPIPDGDKMIVIVSSSHKSLVQPLVDWKNQKGIETELCEYPSETGGTGSSALKSFIQDKYDEEDITYILLIGESGDVPTLSAGGGVSDPSYVLLAGGDKYPDAFVGRFCSSEASKITLMVNKVLTYEMEPDEEGEWYHKGMGIASSQGSPPDKDWVEDMRKVMMDYNYTEVDQIYDPSASKTQVTDGLNDGRSWVNYMGHGSKTSWGTTGFSNSNINSLNNGDKLPVIISVACYNGQFAGSGDCHGEAWLNKSGGGAIVNLSSSISQSWTPPQHAQREMVKVLCEELYLSVGAIIYNGECKMLDNGNDQSTFVTWILFGDPSLLVFTDTPEEVSVTVPNAVQTGNQDIKVTLGSAIDGRVGVVGKESGFLGSAMTSGKPDVTVSVNVPSSESELTLTVVGRNVMPVTKTITVGNVGIVTNIAEQKKILVKHTPHSLAIQIPNAQTHTVSIWNVNGKKVASFELNEAGKWYTVKQPVSSGLHFITVSSEGEKVTQKYYFVK